MHRSGTSLTAGLLSALGVDMGTRLVPADRSNPRGYFEDLDLVEFHQRVFRARFPLAEGGHPDWGWTPSDVVRTGDAEAWREESVALVRRREDTGRPWGFKDPRATVLLDFWDSVLPGPVYVGVYREPSRVADSMRRLGAPAFLDHPDYAWAIWAFYNRRLLDFVRRHRERCILVNVDALVADPDRLPALLRERLGLSVEVVDLLPRIAPELLHRPEDVDPVARLSRHVWPDCAALLDELESIADVPLGSGNEDEKGDARSFRFAPRAPTGELSILLPTRDDAAELVGTLASAEACSAGRHEIVVLDHGTTDAESLRILDRLREAGQPVLRRSVPDLPAVRNALVEAASGRLVLLLGTDRRLRPGFLEEALAAFRADPELGVAHGDSSDGRGPAGDADLECMLRTDEFDRACIVFRRKLWEDVGGFHTELRRGHDEWEFLLHARKRGWRFRHVPVVAVDERVSPAMRPARPGAAEALRDFRRLQWRKHADLLVAATPAWFRSLLGIHPPYPADLRLLPGWKRLPLRAWWHREWARGSRAPARSG